MSKLETMISSNAYDEIVKKVRGKVNESDEVFNIVWPPIKKALEEGDGNIRLQILSVWLGVDRMRVCSSCGSIMEEGWYIDNEYACSDECAAKLEGITMEQFEKWRVYKDDINQYLENEGYSIDIEELTKEECDEIIDNISDDVDRFYTTWY